MKTRILFLILLGMLTAIPSISAADVNSVMNQAVKATTGSGSLTAAFTVSSPSGSGQVKGTISVSGDKFSFKSPQTVIIFNGKTQWTADSESKEINIYDPEPDEIQQINPFAIIRNHRTLYKSKLLSSAKGTYKVELTPKSDAQSITRIILTLNSVSYLPSSIDIHLSDGNIMKVAVTDIKTKVNIPPSTFVLNKGNYPGYEIIDLR